MLSNLSTVVMQVAVLFILIATGTICRKVGFLDKNSVKHLTNIVLYIVTPCVIINSFDRSYDKHLARNLLVCVIVAFATYVLSILIASLCFGKNEVNKSEWRPTRNIYKCHFAKIGKNKETAPGNYPGAYSFAQKSYSAVTAVE